MTQRTPMPTLLDVGPAPLDLALAERDAGALFIANLSGGKDGQAMLLELLEDIPTEQILAVHATLGEIEWPGALEHAQQQAELAGVPFLVAQANQTFLEMVEKRFADRPTAPSFPNAKFRLCTSTLKRGPLEREIRRYTAARNIKRIVNCMGLRASESPSRAKAQAWSRNEKQSVAGRDWHNWLPIHDFSTAEVLRSIRDAGQELHPAYGLGNERLSCQFCIFGSPSDLKNAALHSPELYAKYVQLERRTGYTMHVNRKSLVDLTGIEPSRPAVPQ